MSNHIFETAHIGYIGVKVLTILLSSQITSNKFFAS